MIALIPIVNFVLLFFIVILLTRGEAFSLLFSVTLKTFYFLKGL